MSSAAARWLIAWVSSGDTECWSAMSEAEETTSRLSTCDRLRGAAPGQDDRIDSHRRA
jgi:hypothetical protein